ncbi:MAG: AzlC family ABC transporter permease [Amaricoccus sp.]|uniref:AzlC family ABC transporter permease n=1 Tax=Amaricoccus sp. TaxID=1872485 RepID=UPI0039E4EA70
MTDAAARPDTPALRRAFWLGFRDGLPFLIVIVPFGMLFGVLASEAGWSLTEMTSMTVLVIAGASQFTALQLLSEHAPLIVAIVTALAVNLRLAMYSASLAQQIGATPPLARALAAYCLTDQTYGVAMNRVALGPPMTPTERLVHYFGGAVPICIPWYFATWLGATLGRAIPPAFALDFAVPITFIAIFGPGLRTLPQMAAALVSVVLALAFAGLPYSFGLLVAALGGMTTGALAEVWQEKRR